jgi:hypothetical protein
VLSPGQHLRTFREQLGLTMRDVEMASAAIAAKHGNDDFSIPLSRLSDIETKGIVPSIFRVYSLAVIYRCEMRELLSWFGIDLNDMVTDLNVMSPPRSHRTEMLKDASASVRMPVALDPGFDPRRTANLGRMVEQWGLVPLAYLAHLPQTSYSYGYIGTEDFSMYPLLPPGSFVQIDESKNKVVQGVWRSEYERPIYFVETRSGHTCCWCTMRGDHILLQPHPLSPLQIRMLRHPQDAEVIGQVVGVAMRLGDWRAVDGVPEPKEREALN